MTYAIIEICGKQLKVEPSGFFELDRFDLEVNEELNIDKVLLVSHEGEIHVGQPYVEGASINGTILKHSRGKGNCL